MATQRPRICVVGSCMIDLISFVPRLPRMGETLIGDKFHMGYGGKGANQAVMAAKLGAQVSMVAKVGEDVFGEGTIQNFREMGVDTTHVGLDSEFSGVAPIAVDPDGHNSIIIVPGANLGLSVDDVLAARETMAAAQVLICQLEIRLETTLAAFRLARELGVTTILNPAPAQELPDELLRLTDICVPNETETELLTGRTVGSLEEAEAAARALLDRGPRQVILTLGERGALLVNQDEVAHEAVEQVKAVDTTGAGDAFVGALAYFLALGKTIREAIRYANAIAAISVQAPGTQVSFPTREQVQLD